MPDVVRAVVNGESVEVAAGTRLLAFLEGRGVDVRRVAVERAREVVPRARHAEIEMREGDEFEVVAFVGGG
jgi:thiamine biosynthesis protein ThiS